MGLVCLSLSIFSLVALSCFVCNGSFLLQYMGPSHQQISCDGFINFKKRQPMGHVLDLMGSFGPTLQMKLFGPLHGLSSTLTDIGSFKGLKPFHFCFLIPQIIVDFFSYFGLFQSNQHLCGGACIIVEKISCFSQLNLKFTHILRALAQDIIKQKKVVSFTHCKIFLLSPVSTSSESLSISFLHLTVFNVQRSKRGCVSS